MVKVKPTLNQADVNLLKKTFVTKDDAKNFLTRSDDDLKALKDVVSVAIEEKIDEKGLVTKDDIGHLPDKEEFHSANDKLMKELKAIREEQPVLSKQVSNNSDRLEKLEKIHPRGRHLTL